jgi:hypothetical protein
VDPSRPFSVASQASLEFGEVDRVDGHDRGSSLDVVDAVQGGVVGLGVRLVVYLPSWGRQDLFVCVCMGLSVNESGECELATRSSGVCVYEVDGRRDPSSCTHSRRERCVRGSSSSNDSVTVEAAGSSGSGV